MTDLTEQCKQRKLPDGLYWVKHDGVINILDNYEAHLTDVEEVLAEVPSYEEWQASENYIDYLKQCISVYESKDKQATETSIAYNELLEENTKLKELLKECRDVMDKAGFMFAKIDDVKKAKRLLKRIDEVLGEDK